MDQLPQIQIIVRDAILDGLIVSTTIGEYKRTCKALKDKPYALEAYIQELWDAFPEKSWNVPAKKDQTK